jgi:FkbM family methyltransferase
MKRLRRLVSLTDAFVLSGGGPRGELARIRVKPLGADVFIRPGTSDLACFEQVFVGREYAPPYDIDPRVIIDAGANVGAATLFFADRYPQARIIALEPEPTNFEVLRRNCDGRKNVTLLEAALWSCNTRLSLVNPTAQKYAAAFDQDPAGGEVAALTVDWLMQTYGLARVDLLKMDVEGAEREIFADRPGWLAKVDVLAIELHDQSRRGCAQALYSALHGRDFQQEIRGEILAIRLGPIPPEDQTSTQSPMPGR